MVNKVIEINVSIVFRDRLGYPMIISNEDKTSAIMPIPICKDRNQLGGLLLITYHFT
jgi:hypothetical protein